MRVKKPELRLSVPGRGGGSFPGPSCQLPKRPFLAPYAAAAAAHRDHSLLAQKLVFCNSDLDKSTTVCKVGDLVFGFGNTYTSIKYTPMRCTPVRCTPVRYTPARYTPVRYTLVCEVHACICKMHVYEVWEVHVWKMYVCKVQLACECV